MRPDGDGVRHERVLVVDLLGGLGDLVMVLPVVHALARRHGPVRVLTHAPGDALLRRDPAVASVLVAPRGEERTAVRAALDGVTPDLVVSTTRYGGIADEIEGRGVRCVTDLWRRPPPEERVSDRYLRILAGEGLVDPGPVAPVVHLDAGEREGGAQLLAAHLPPGAPVLIVPSAGMAVKRWPHATALAVALHRAGRPVATVGERGTAVGPAQPLPATDLRGLAAIFAAVAQRGGVVVGPDTGPLRVADAVGARTVGLFGPTLAARYGLGSSGIGGGAVDLQGLPGCPHRRPTAITEQECWWEARCPLSPTGPACMADLGAADVLSAVEAALSEAALSEAAGRGIPSAAWTAGTCR